METIASKLTRAEMVAIADVLNTRNGLGISRVNRFDTPTIVKLLAENEAQTIEIGAELGITLCPTANAPDTVPTSITAIYMANPPPATTKPGVLDQIELYLIKHATFTIAELHRHLCKRFPDRNAKKMLTTIKTQVPTRMSQQRGYSFKREKGGVYHVSRT